MAALKSWLQIPTKSDFSLANIPFGIISTKVNQQQRPAIAIGDYALDLQAFGRGNGFSGLQAEQFSKESSVFNQTTLNSFAALGRPVHQRVRQYLQNIFLEDTKFPELLKTNQTLRKEALIPLSEVENHLPLSIGDYTDFFAGRNHAFNVGTIFRGPENALNPNYNHIPVGYHGRASSVVVSGTPIRRPCGQILPDPKAKTPVFSPCKRLDMELELGMFICKGNQLGEPIPVDVAEDHIFGYVLMNDWSARDVQVWEYVPLGPFNAKNFGTTISPWVVLADALESSTTQGLKNEVELQSYLQEKRSSSGNVLDINLKVDLTTSKGNTTTITQTSSKNLLWSWPQMIAHHSIGGCNMRTGDLLGSGTISGTESGTQGSLLEQIQGGKVALKLNGGEERKFLEDGDTVSIQGWVGEDDNKIGFGECVGTIKAALSL